MDIGPAELIIVLLIVLLIFGGAKLPKLARSMGQAAHEFRHGLSGAGDDDEKPEQTAAPATDGQPSTGTTTKLDGADPTSARDEPPAGASGS